MRNARMALAAVAAAMLACALMAGCSRAAEEPAEDEAPEAQEEALPKASPDEVRTALLDAANAPYSTVTFDVKQVTKSTGTAQAEDGSVSVVQQSMTVQMKGELDVTDGARNMHMTYSSWASSTPERIGIEFYQLGDEARILQDDIVYSSTVEEVGIGGFMDTVTGPISASQIEQTCDITTNMGMEEKDGETIVSLTLDVNKLQEQGLIDMSSLPEGTQLASMVESYTIGTDGHIRTVRTVAQTTGSPSYTVTQTSQFSAYDETVMPTAPEPTPTEEVVYDEGTGGGETYYYYETPSTGDSGAAQGSSDAGRAYITDYNGNIHYLDEPGSEIRDLGGATVFIDANGEWYFLSTGDEEPTTTTDPIDVDAILAEEAAGNGSGDAAGATEGAAGTSEGAAAGTE